MSMMSRLLRHLKLAGVVMCLVLSFVGCLSSHVVSEKPDSLLYTYQKVNQCLEGKDVTVALLNGQELEVSNAVLASDSTRFVTQSSGKQVSVPTPQIVKIEHTDKGRGTIEGLEIGAITGSAFGLSVILGSHLHSTGYDPNLAGPYIILGSVGAIFGGVFGTLAGSSIGHVDRYTLNTQNPPGTDTQLFRLPDSSVIHRDAITVDVASSFQGSDFEGGWRTTRALRAGFGRIVSKTLAVNGYLEYYEFHISPANGNSGLIPQSARRRDLALYADVSLVRVIVMGIGIYYTTSDPVYQISPFYTGQSKYFDSGFSAGRLFVTVGLAYDIYITNELFVPIGFYFRSSYAMNMAFPFFGRVGVGVSF
jgi:hypothetical protein